MLKLDLSEIANYRPGYKIVYFRLSKKTKWIGNKKQFVMLTILNFLAGRYILNENLSKNIYWNTYCFVTLYKRGQDLNPPKKDYYSESESKPKTKGAAFWDSKHVLHPLLNIDQVP